MSKVIQLNEKYLAQLYFIKILEKNFKFYYLCKIEKQKMM